MKFNVGNYVITNCQISNKIYKGTIGKVLGYGIGFTSIGVEFNEKIGIHDCRGITTCLSGK